MKKVNINRRLKLVLYDGINEMPMGNFREFNRFVMLDAGLGSDIQDIDNKFAAVIKFIMQGKKEEGAKELINTRQAIALVLNGTNLKQMSFVPFIHTLNGERVTDLSEEGAREVLRKMELAMVSQGWLIDMLGGLKKKIDSEFDVLLSSYTKATGRQNEYYINLKRRTKLVYQSIITGQDLSTQIDDIDDLLFAMFTPAEYSGPDGLEAKYTGGFEEICAMMKTQGIQNPKWLTVLEFYKTMDTLKHINKQKAKAGRPQGKKGASPRRSRKTIK